MEQARWNRIEELLQAALDVEAGQRAAFLHGACGADAELYNDVDALLAGEPEGALLETPAIAHVAPHLAAPPLTGQQISHYRVEERIGAGGMSDVYRARDESLQRVVALKTLPPEFTADARRVRRFEQEALAASRLNHPNIITIFEVLDAGGVHLIVTELVEGETLRQLLTDPETGKGRKLPVNRALDIAIQTAAALKAAHTAWIIHRDIKPENIMVRADGLVKVLDFGIAKMADELCEGDGDGRMRANPAAAPHLTFDGAVLGTASYMSPEQAAGAPLDGRTDLYSLGLVLYEMLTGERFLTAVTRTDVLEATGRPHGPAAKSRFAGVPKAIERLLRKMLRPARDERYASAAELLGELLRVRRSIENTIARRMLRFGALAVVVAVALVGVAALLSLTETWEERVLRQGHSAAARQVTLSPDGRLAASCGEDGRVFIWDLARRERLATLEHAALKVAFSPDGRWLATGGVDGSIALWDARTFAPIRLLPRSRRDITAMAFSPDATLLGAGTAHSFALWKTSDWKKTGEWPVGVSFGTVFFYPDGRRLQSSGGFRIDDPAGERRLVSSDEMPHGNWMAISGDASQMATVDSKGAVTFYRLAADGTATPIGSHRAHQDHGRSIAFSPDGRLVASTAEDIVLWDWATQRTIARFEYPAIVWSVVFSPDGRSLVSSHGDGAVLIWDVAERRCLASLNEHSGAVRAIAFGPDGEAIASGGDDRSIALWDLPSGRKEVLQGHETRVTGVAYSGDGQRLASADHDGKVIVWDVAKRRPLATIDAPEEENAYTAAMSRDGAWVATTHGVYSTRDGRCLIRFPSNSSLWQVYGAAFSNDGRVLATATNAGWVVLWDMATGQIIDKQHIRESLITVSVSPDGKWLVTGADEGPVRLWAVSPLREVALLGRHSARVKSVAFSPDGATVASAGDDKMLALWDVRARKLRTRIGTHASPIYAVAFSPDGQRLASGEHDRSVRVYTRRRSLWGFALR